MQIEWYWWPSWSINLAQKNRIQSESQLSSSWSNISSIAWQNIEPLSQYEDEEKSNLEHNFIHTFEDHENLEDDQTNKINSIPNQKVKKKSSSVFKFRSDVVLKTIFRCFRKYFINDFKRYYNFTYTKNNPQMFVSKVRKYLIKLFGYESETLRTVFICIIDTKQKYFQVSEDQEHILLMINDLMYNFNNNKMIELASWVEFTLILKLLI